MAFAFSHVNKLFLVRFLHQHTAFDNVPLYSYCTAVGIIKKSSHKIGHSVISYYKDISDDDLFNGICACL